MEEMSHGEEGENPAFSVLSALRHFFPRAALRRLVLCGVALEGYQQLRGIPHKSTPKSSVGLALTFSPASASCLSTCKAAAAAAESGCTGHRRGLGPRLRLAFCAELSSCSWQPFLSLQHGGEGALGAFLSLPPVKQVVFR